MKLLKIKNHLDKFLPLYVTLCMIAGFYTGLKFNIKAHIDIMKNLNLLVVIAMIYPMMINLKLERLKNSAKLWKQIIVALVVGLVVAPLIMYALIWFVGLFTRITPNLALGLLLAVVVPCSSMAIAYTGLSDGNIELSTIIVALSFTLAIAVVPFWLKIFASSLHVSISTWLLVKTILIVVIIPMILGILTRLYFIKRMGTDGFLKLKPLFPSVSLIGMYAIVFLIFMEKAKLIYSKIAIVGISLMPLALYYILSLAVITVIDKSIKISYEDHMSITFTSVGKNEGTAMAIAMSAGMGLMAIPPAITPILQIPFLVGYLKMRKSVERYFSETRKTEEVSEANP